MTTKILVFGSSGMLGNYVKTYFVREGYDVVEINRDMIDAYQTNTCQISDVLREYQGTKVVVVNCIGIIPQRTNLGQLRIYIKVNSLFPHLLASCCERFGYHLIHITTDCVYNGSRGDYDEDDEPDETNIYGVSKLLGEPSNCCIIRTSIIGEELHNKKSLLEWVKSQNGKTINGFVNHHWNGVTCLQLVKIIDQLIQNDMFWSGVRHVCSPRSVSKYELVSMIVEIFGLNIKVDKMETQVVDKTLRSKYEQITVSDLYEQIKELREFNL